MDRKVLQRAAVILGVFGVANAAVWAADAQPTERKCLLLGSPEGRLIKGLINASGVCTPPVYGMTETEAFSVTASGTGTATFLSSAVAPRCSPGYEPVSVGSRAMCARDLIEPEAP